jgi:FO synthase
MKAHKGSHIGRIEKQLDQGLELSETDIVQLFNARGSEFDEVCQLADELRRSAVGDTVTYVVNRNINYTNICSYRCGFCAFSKSSTLKGLRDKAYVLDIAEIVRRAEEAWERGATEVCLQGGIHPDFTGETYLEICRAIRSALPALHIHAFSPLEIQQGAATLNISVRSFLEKLKESGLSTLPGTAAEILDDEVRRIICPDKLTTSEWLEVVETAHQLKLPTTATIMFGHVDQPYHWARHLRRIRDLQVRTNGFTEFVPLPFIHQEAPLYRRDSCRQGPTFRESILMHAVSRIVLHGHISNIQASWTKMGRSGITQLLNAGVNDLGGTLMNESISRAAGTRNGQELPPQEMDQLIASVGREPLQRTTAYGRPVGDRVQRSYRAEPLKELYVEAVSRRPTAPQPTA